MLVYVDDILIFGKTEKDVQNGAKVLKENFEMKDMGEPKMFFGITIRKTKEKDGYTLSMEDSVSKLEKDYKTDVCQRELKTPIVKGFDKNEVKSNPLNSNDHKRCISIVGSLLYLANTVRIDIAFTVSYLSRFLEPPTEHHFKTAKRGMQYVIPTKKFKLTYRKKKTGLEYDDFRFHDEIIHDYPNRGKNELVAVSGYIILFNNNIVARRSTKQDGVAGSTSESEYIGLSEAAKSALSIRNLLQEIQIKIPFIELAGDNKSALTLCAHNTDYKKHKHIELRFHLIRDCVEKKIIRLNYI